MCTSFSHERIGPTSLVEFAVNITVKRSTSHNGVFANGSLLPSEHGRQTKIKASQSVRSEGMHVKHRGSRHNLLELVKGISYRLCRYPCVEERASHSIIEHKNIIEIVSFHFFVKYDCMMVTKICSRVVDACLHKFNVLRAI